MARDKVVLAYSGGLDTSVAVKWINETYGLDVIAYTCDLRPGAAGCIHRDPREGPSRPGPSRRSPRTFATSSSTSSPSFIDGGCPYEGKYPLATANSVAL